MKIRIGALVLALASCGLGACATKPLDRGIGLAQRGDLVGAERAFDEAIVASPASATAYRQRGAVRAQRGDVDGAISDYSQAIMLGATDADVWYSRGVAKIARKDYRGAIGDLTQAVSKNPQHARAFFARGTAYSLGGQADLARADWQRAIELEPDPGERARMQAAASTLAPPRPAASPATPDEINSRTLAARGLEKELRGDRAGALADLTAALAAEVDPERRQGIRNLIRLLDPPR